MTNEESFKNACHKATNSYDLLVRVDRKHKDQCLWYLLEDAQEVQAAAYRLLKAHGWEVK